MPTTVLPVMCDLKSAKVNQVRKEKKWGQIKAARHKYARSSDSYKKGVGHAKVNCPQSDTIDLRLASADRYSPLSTGAFCDACIEENASIQCSHDPTNSRP